MRIRWLQFGLMAAMTSLTVGCFQAQAPEALADSEDGSPAARLADPAACLTPGDSAQMAQEVLRLVNLERAERHLPPVKENVTLHSIADRYACKMIHDGFFGHNHPTTGAGLRERARDAMYPFFAVGENLAAGQQSPGEVMKVWMESDSHREVILDPRWKEAGVAVRSGGEYGHYWVLEFGDPLRL